MRSKFNSVFAFAAAAAITFAGVGSAIAATVAVSGVGGAWTALLPPTGPTNIKGLNTNAVSWGTPFEGSNTGNQSGYSFVGAAAGNIETGTDFDLGTFTHNNFVINKGTSITGANLNVVFNLVIGGVSQAVTTAFNFNHWETDNTPAAGASCANGAANGAGVNSGGCADRVTILNNTSSDQTFEVDGFKYILEITGFTIAGQLFSEFWTTEDESNSAILKARFTLVGPTTGGGGGQPVPSPVPLPAAGWMMLAGIAALAAARARRKS